MKRYKKTQNKAFYGDKNKAFYGDKNKAFYGDKNKAFYEDKNSLGDLVSLRFVELIFAVIILLYLSHSVLYQNDQSYATYIDNIEIRYENSDNRNIKIDFLLFSLSVATIFALIFSNSIVKSSRNSKDASMYGAVLGALIMTSIVAICSITDLTFPVKSGIFISLSGAIIGLLLTMWVYFRHEK